MGIGGIDSLLDISKRALFTQSQSIRVIGNNIANVNTPGYSRRKTEIISTQSVDLAGGAFGTGAEIASVARMVDKFLTQEQLLRINDSAYSSIREEFLKRAEGPFSVDQESGRVGYEMSRFFSTIEDLQENPSSIPLRSAVIQQGQTLVNSIRYTYSVVSDLQREADRRIDSLVTDVNRLTDEVANLNAQIQAGEVGNQQNLTLRDEREQRLRDLSELISVQWTETSDGVLNVTLENGFGLVVGTNSNDLEYTYDPSFSPVGGYPKGLDGQDLGFIVYNYGDDTTPAHVNLMNIIAGGGGELGGLLSLRGTQGDTDTSPFDASGSLVDVASHMETIARDLLTRFNTSYAGPDEDGTNLTYDPSSGDIDGNAPSIFGLFNAESALTNANDIDGVLGATAGDLAVNISYANQLTFNVANPRELAFSEDLDAVAGSRQYAPGDGGILADLLAERERIVDYKTEYGIGAVDVTGTIEELYNTTVSIVGGYAATATNNLLVATDRASQVNEAVASMSGVSLDEEFARLINYQKAYEAAARMIRVGDELLSEILSIVGR